MKSTKKILIIIPARGGSKGIKRKNIRIFNGKPLIAHVILLAKQLKVSGFKFRTIVSTEDHEIARISKKYGAEIPFLRPRELAQDNSLVIDAIFYTLDKLKSKENYNPDYLMILETTGPLKEQEDIYKCIKKIQEKNTDAVVTVDPTHPLFYHLGKGGELVLVNKPPKKFVKNKRLRGFERQAFPAGYKLNCGVNLIKVGILIKEKTFLPAKTKAVPMPYWRGGDIDTPEDFIVAEFLFKNAEKIKKSIKNFK